MSVLGESLTLLDVDDENKAAIVHEALAHYHRDQGNHETAEIFEARAYRHWHRAAFFVQELLAVQNAPDLPDTVDDTPRSSRVYGHDDGAGHCRFDPHCERNARQRRQEYRTRRHVSLTITEDIPK